jgi:hypothetical protein
MKGGDVELQEGNFESFAVLSKALTRGCWLGASEERDIMAI